MLLKSAGIMILTGAPGSNYGTVKCQSLASELAVLDTATMHKAYSLHVSLMIESIACVIRC